MKPYKNLFLNIILCLIIFIAFTTQCCHNTQYVSTYYNIGSKLIRKPFTLHTSTCISSEGVLLKLAVAVCTNLSLPATTFYCTFGDSSSNSPMH